MAKPKGAGNVPNRPVYSRISYLYQAASYLSRTSNHDQQQSPNPQQAAADANLLTEEQLSSPGCKSKQALSRYLLNDMRAASRKAQIRMSPEMKRTICKFCDTLLVEGETCTSVVENKSKGGKKPWADVLVITCTNCGGVKRFPIQARQKRRPHREAPAPHEEAADAEKNDVSMG